MISSVPVSGPLPTAVRPTSSYDNHRAAHAQVADEDIFYRLMVYVYEGGTLHTICKFENECERVEMLSEMYM